MKKAHWFIIFLLFAISCLDEPDCFRLNNNIVGIAFKRMYDGKPDTVFVIGAQALAAPNVIFNPSATVSTTYLPLDFFSKQTAFTLATFFETNHMVFGYDIKTQFVSQDCGTRYVLTGLTLLESDYDSVNLVSTVPSASGVGTHLEVYRCPRTDIMKVAFRQLQGTASIVLAPRTDLNNGISSSYTGAIYKDTALSVVRLPLSPGAASLKYVFDFQDYESRFMTVNYKTDAWDYNSKYCGSKNLKLYKDLAVDAKGIGHDFDSLLVVRDSLQDPPVTNIYAYRCPDIGFMRVSFRTPSTPVKADSLDVVRLTASVTGKDSVLSQYQNVKLATFTLPLIGGAGITSTEFTFELRDGTVKKLKIDYIQDSKQVFQACGIQTTFNTLSLASSDFTTQPGNDTARPKVDHTSFPIATNFEIIK